MITMIKLTKIKLQLHSIFVKSISRYSRWGMLNLVNQLFKIYFKLNKLHLTKPLIRAVDSSPLRDKYRYTLTKNWSHFFLQVLKVPAGDV